MRKTTKERRSQLIDEAINIIHNKGSMGLSTRELAASAEITEGAIYRHFSSKDEILEGILDRIKESNHNLKSRLNKNGSSLSEFIFFHLEMFEKMPQMTSVVFSQALIENKPELRQKFNSILKEKQKILFSIIETGKAKGIYKEIDTQIISGMIQGYIRLLINRWKNNEYNFSLLDEGKKLCDTLNIILLK